MKTTGFTESGEAPAGSSSPETSHRGQHRADSGREWVRRDASSESSSSNPRPIVGTGDFSPDPGPIDAPDRSDSKDWNFADLLGKLGVLRDFDRNPRTAAARIRAALLAKGLASEISPEVGCLVRALTASKTAGSFLCIGEGAGEIGGWVLDAMDYSSGLVTLVQDEEEAAVLERELDRDVRASVHRQDPESFLTDVRAHRFDLIVDLVSDDHPRAVLLGLGLLRAGGVYFGSHLATLPREGFTERDSPPDGHPPGLDPDDFEVAQWGDRLDSLIVVRRTQPIRPRRGSKSKAR